MHDEYRIIVRLIIKYCYPGRRLVELEMQIALVHIIRVFQLTYHEEELGMKQRLLNVPDRSVDITFDDLHDHI